MLKKARYISKNKRKKKNNTGPARNVCIKYSIYLKKNYGGVSGS
jgi:hypothetical protein